MNTLDETARAIGALESAVGAQRDAFIDHARREEMDRETILSKLEEIKSDVAILPSLHARVNQAETDVTELKKWRDRMMAVAATAGAVFTAIFEGFRAFGHDILAIFQRH